MRVLARAVFAIGAFLMIGAAFMAFNTYMTDERRADSRAAINARLDAGAEQYERRHEDGCVFRCRRQGVLAHFIVNLRDGIFLSLPFKPSEVFPAAQPGWTVTAFSYDALEPMLGQPVEKAIFRTTTEQSLLSDLQRITKEPKSGEVRIYRKDDKTIAIGIKIYRDGLHAVMDGEKFRIKEVVEPFAEIEGVLIHKHPQYSRSSETRKYTPVAYQHLSIYMDGQVEITIMSDAPNEELAAVLSGLDLASMVQELPKIPSNYASGKGVMIYETEEEGQDES